MMGCVRWQNRRDNAFLRLLYLCCFQLLNRVRAFLRQGNGSLIPILAVYWSPSTLSKHGTVSFASKSPPTAPTISFHPRSTNQQQRNGPNSSLQCREREPTLSTLQSGVRAEPEAVEGILDCS